MNLKMPAIIMFVLSGALSFGASIMEDADIGMDSTITTMQTYGYVLGLAGFALTFSHIFWSVVYDD